MSLLTKTTYVSAFAVALSSFNATALEIYNDEKTTFNLSGTVTVYYLNDGENEELRDGFSRYIFDTSRQLKDGWQANAFFDWGIQVSQTESLITTTNDGLTSTGVTSDITWLREGFVGVQHKQYGEFKLGKAWGVTYAITGVTDLFEIFGSKASGVYNFGTDGGFSGTGAAEQVMQYKNTWGNFDIGLQYQASDEFLDYRFDENGEPSAALNFDNAYGVSLIYNALYDIGIGFGYNKADLSIAANGQISESVDDSSTSAHITYRNSRDYGLHVAMIMVDMENHEKNDLNQIMSKSLGFELYSSYRFDNDIALILGYNSLNDNSDQAYGSKGDYHLNYAIVGVNYYWDDEFYLFTEARLDNSTLSEGSTMPTDDAIGIGMRYEF